MHKLDQKLKIIQINETKKKVIMPKSNGKQISSNVNKVDGNAERKRPKRHRLMAVSPRRTCISCHVSSPAIERVVGCRAGATTGS
jgi:hypothetical protein